MKVVSLSLLSLMSCATALADFPVQVELNPSLVISKKSLVKAAEFLRNHQGEDTSKYLVGFYFDGGTSAPEEPLSNHEIAVVQMGCGLNVNVTKNVNRPGCRFLGKSGFISASVFLTSKEILKMAAGLAKGGLSFYPGENGHDYGNLFIACSSESCTVARSSL